ncbi:baseplate assembly protein [Lysobacter arvi]|uniref:Baseplate J/gp47 family protein n=1 Tax=Lysobacter arvi TaxID=3038776 RepID=A0ABU1CB56_9GAMM|nr:baseplate J/gp47 family protein [Lysobacter arvi]MDR0182406.1 baseplate J/gp47 family protein [Lysobacter arvi]
MYISTAVDLSRLPVPDIVEQVSYERNLAELTADFKSRCIARGVAFDALVESDPAMILLQVYAYRVTLLRQDFNDRLKSVLLAYATGTMLDHLGALMGVTRLQLDAGDPSRGIAPTFENDGDFRRRIVLAPESYSVAGPEGAYLFHTLSADPRVLDASIDSPRPGEVVVSVLSRTGDGIAPPDLLAAVNAALSAENVRPLDDEVSVIPATLVPYQIRATIYCLDGPDAAVVRAESRRRLDAYVESVHMLGRDVTLSGLYAALHSEGVQRVELHEPKANIVIARAQASRCTGIELLDGGIGE